MPKLYKILAIYLSVISFASHGQLQQAFDHYNVENGLSHNTVLDIIQDDHGFIWIGTRNGLNRFDGHKFKHYLSNIPDTTLPAGRYTSDLFLDSQKKLWVGTSAGLSIYNDDTDSFTLVRMVSGDMANSGANNIYHIFEDRKNRMWIATKNGLYISRDKKANKFNRFIIRDATGRKLQKEEILTIYEDYKGNIWVGTSTGMMKIFPDLVTMRFFVNDKNNPSGLNDNYVTTFCEDSKNRLWIGTLKGGLNLFDHSTSTFRHFSSESGSGLPNNNIRTIIKNKNGFLWIGTMDGLSIFNPETFKAATYRHSSHERRSLSQNSVYPLFIDANESLWVGTYYGGINVLHPQNIPFSTFQNSKYYSSISNDVVSSFQEDAEQNLWIGTEGGGLNCFIRDKTDPSTGHFTVFRNNPKDPGSIGSNNIKTIFKDIDNNIWVGTYAGGLNLFDPRSGKFKRFLYDENNSDTFNSEILFVTEDSQKRFWVATKKNLLLFKRNGRNLEPLPNTYFSNELIPPKTLFESSDQSIWIGSHHSFMCLKKGGEKFLEVNLDPLNTKFINCITEDRKKQIWLATDAGIVKLNKGKVEIFTTSDGLPHNYVLGIVEDKKGFLWISTSNGLCRFDPKKEAFRTYTTIDGLSGNEFINNAHYKTSKGELFFGGVSGFTSFSPDNVKSNTYDAPIRFTGLTLFNSPVGVNEVNGILNKNFSFTDEITLKYNQNDISVEFALLSFVRSDKNRYAYFLEGFNQSWTYSKNPVASFDRLQPGTYTLLVKGANDDGLWSDPISLRINVLPPFWKTWWAYSTYLFILIWLTFIISRFFYLRALVEKENELQLFKLNFFTNISHEIRTHLSLITGPLEKLMRTGKEEKNVEMIKRNFDNLLKLVNELMDFRKAESGHLKLNVTQNNAVDFVKEIFMSFENVFETKLIQSDITSTSSDISLYFDREQLKKVLYNLLTNAFKFTANQGTISLNITEKDSAVEIRVTDNGKGISPENLGKLFVNYFQEEDSSSQNTGYGIGLAFSKSIVELHKGTLKAESGVINAEERKTTFTISLLKGKGHYTPEQLKRGEQFVDTISIPVFNPYQGEINDVTITAEKDKEFTILIVEDNPEIRNFVSELFIRDYNVLVSENGLKGWEMASTHIPDLIISDVMMPEMNGFELCKKLKTDIRTNHIPVILLTAKSYGEDQINGLEFGADIYLTKPFSVRVLELQVNNLLQSRTLLLKKFSKQLTILSLPPDENVLLPENEIDQNFLDKFMAIIEENMDNTDLNVAHISREIGMSHPILYKKVKAVTGMTVNDFIKSVKMKKAATLLKQGRMTVYEVANAIGYDDWKYFSREFKKQYRVSPGKF